MDGRQEQLVHCQSFIDGVSGFGLSAAYDTKARGFRFSEGVYGTTEEFLQKATMKNDLNAHIGRAFASMNDLRA